MPQHEAEALLAEAEALGWEEALERRLPDEEASGVARSDWRFLVPLTERSRVLDIGAGWGANTAAIAPEVGVVVATDERAECARLLEIRARQSGLDNVMPIVAAPPTIPFPDETFDLVILDRMLDRESSFPAEMSPREAQLLLLRRIRQKLAPGGHLYVGVDNRFGFPHFPGAGRNRAKPPRRERRPHTRGLDGYRKLFREAGFAAADFYATIRRPGGARELLPLDDGTVFDFWAPRSVAGPAESRLKLRLARAAFRAGLLPRIMPRFSILVRKGSAR
jgi:SAM-dependent methyltransferase